MVFYFTAAGNSLYVAKQLDAAPVSIPQAVHEDDLAFQDDVIGIVCPVFGRKAPPMVTVCPTASAWEREPWPRVGLTGPLASGNGRCSEK